MTDKQANMQRRYEIAYDDLPVSCPMADMRLWDSHPKVFLPVEKTGYAVCPYCDAKFILKNFDPQQAVDVECDGDDHE